jgi:hypothetical protein
VLALFSWGILLGRRSQLSGWATLRLAVVNGVFRAGARRTEDPRALR